MDGLRFEDQLSLVKSSLGKGTVEALCPLGDWQFDYIARSLRLLINSEVDLPTLIEIYGHISVLHRVENPAFPYKTYRSAMKKFEGKIGRYDTVLVMAFVRFGMAKVPERQIPTDRFHLVNKDAFNMLREFVVIEKSTGGDEMKGAYGRYGYEVTNPIPVSGSAGLEAYMKQLFSAEGRVFTYERIGSFQSDNIKSITDGYRILFEDAGDATIFVNLYNSETSRKAPDRFYLS